MNWSKAKTILIIVFLLADIFLFYVSYSGDLGYNSENGSVVEVLEHLKNRDIAVKGLIPNKGNPGSQLYVKYKLFNSEKAIESFFNSDTNVFIRENENKIIVENNLITVEIFKNGEIIYLNKSIDNVENSEINELQAERMIDDFLKSLNIDRDDTIIINKVIEDNSINIMYNQVYKNQFIDKTFLDMKVTNN
ncbi:MAG: two-component system regulatory protein YycI, partial [Firmicutes bacterium]|nr:two-component system regulatory protein YycI [Bacillota bacterium]